MYSEKCQILRSQVYIPTVHSPPIGHAFSRALRNPGACSYNAICVFSVRFFLSQRIYCFSQKKVFLFLFFKITFFFSKDLLYFFHIKKVFSFFFLFTFFFYHYFTPECEKLIDHSEFAKSFFWFSAVWVWCVEWDNQITSHIFFYSRNHLHMSSKCICTGTSHPWLFHNL